jgi:outer membrane protein assembly complex protein YaeT
VRWVVLALALGALGAVPHPAAAVQLDALDPLAEWKLRALHVEGNHALSTSTLTSAMTTRARRWFALWQPYPDFDPVAFRTDLERLAALYRAHGYYHARLTYDVELPAEGDAVTVTIWIDEGPPVHVASVDLDVATLPPGLPDRDALRASLKIAPGDVFTEDAYDAARARLRQTFRAHGYARVDVAKRARVDVEADTAEVRYTVTPGPACVFGTVRVTGLAGVDEAVVRNEVAWHAGEAFDPKLLTTTESRLRGLRLFRVVRLDEDQSKSPRVDVDVHVTEAPPHEIRLAIGYDTEEQVRGLAGWRAYDFFGGARQLGFTARVSALRRTIAADFLQPHFPTDRSRFRLIFAQEQQDESDYTVNQTRLLPRLEWNPTGRVTVYGYYRVELDLLSGVPGSVERALPGGTPSTTLLSGLALGVDWNRTDDFLDPTRGWTTSLLVEPVGGFLGGETNFVRATGEGRAYAPLGLGFVVASRLRLGIEQPYAGTTVVPLWERFFAGGINSVRGYARHRLGPLSRTDRPYGGESLTETSIELRHPITETIGGAVFLDGGRVRKAPTDVGFADLRLGSGFGVRVKSPVGPLRVDFGFPLDPRGRDAPWQVYFSVGETF